MRVYNKCMISRIIQRIINSIRSVATATTTRISHHQQLPACMIDSDGIDILTVSELQQICTFITLLRMLGDESLVVTAVTRDSDEIYINILSHPGTYIIPSYKMIVGTDSDNNTSTSHEVVIQLVRTRKADDQEILQYHYAEHIR